MAVVDKATTGLATSFSGLYRKRRRTEAGTILRLVHLYVRLFGNDSQDIH